MNKQLNYSTAKINDLLKKLDEHLTELPEIKESITKLTQLTDIKTATQLEANTVPKEGTIYNLGTISTLNLKAGVPNSTKETIIFFDSSADGCEVRIATNQPYVGTLETSPRKSYIMSIQNGIIIMAPIQ